MVSMTSPTPILERDEQQSLIVDIMQTKHCSKCSANKPVECFGKASKSSDGLHWWCRQCLKDYQVSNIIRYRGLHLKYHQTFALSRQNWRRANASRIAVYSRKYKSDHRARRSEIDALRYSTDMQFKLRKILRERLRKATLGIGLNRGVFKLLGCDVGDFKNYIQSQFRTGMSWNNWSIKGWHLDHKRPLADFDLSNPADLALACHYSNLQPLWWFENLSKGRRNFHHAGAEAVRTENPPTQAPNGGIFLSR
jgi:hypothetical protein